MAPLGLLLAAGETVDDIAADLPRFALIALDFPKFSDGRAFSTARLLREKYGYAGELRAVGNVLADQIPLMRRVGFDTFEVTNAPTRRALTEGRIAEVTLHYQPAAVRASRRHAALAQAHAVRMCTADVGSQRPFVRIWRLQRSLAHSRLAFDSPVDQKHRLRPSGTS